MTGNWTGGVVTSREGDEPPTVERWRPVDAAGDPSAFPDVAGPIAYRTVLADPRVHPEERLLLVLGGTYGRASVWHNDEFLGDHEVHIAPKRIELEPAAENELVVVCERPGVTTGDSPDAVPVHEEYDARVGRRWEISLERRPKTFISDLRIRPRLGEGTGRNDVTGHLVVELEVDAGDPIDDAVTFSLRPEGFGGGGSMDRTPVEAAAGERTTVSKTVEVRDPSLWWPHGYGPQHRYALRVKLGEDSLERTVGFRSVDLDDDGLVVNGRRINACGFTRLLGAGSDPLEDVARAKAANATILRARGHVPSRAFFDTCDREGVLVWQDLPTTTGSDALDRKIDLASGHVSAFGHHPSLATYTVEDTPVDPFETPLGTGFLAKVTFRWRVWRTKFDRTNAERVAEALPNDVSALPVAGPPGIDPDATHLAPGWSYLEASDVEWLLDRYPSLGRVVGGFGSASITDDDVGPGKVTGVDPERLERWASDAESSLAYQATTIRTIGEALRRRGSSVVVASTLRDVDPGGGAGILAVDGSKKPAFEVIARTYEPVQSFLEGPPADGSADIVLVNGTDERVEASIEWNAVEASGSLTATADGFGSDRAGTIEVPTDAPAITLETTLPDRTVRNRYSL